MDEPLVVADAPPEPPDPAEAKSQPGPCFMVCTSWVGPRGRPASRIIVGNWPSPQIAGQVAFRQVERQLGGEKRLMKEIRLGRVVIQSHRLEIDSLDRWATIAREHRAARVAPPPEVADD